MIWATCCCLSWVMLASEVTRLLSACAFVLESSVCAVFCSW